MERYQLKAFVTVADQEPLIRTLIPAGPAGIGLSIMAETKPASQRPPTVEA